MEFQIPILDIVEVVDKKDLKTTQVKFGEEFLNGFTILRGDVVTLIDLEKLLQYHLNTKVEMNTTKTKHSKILIISLYDEKKDKDVKFGLLVDEIYEIIEIGDEQIETIDNFGVKKVINTGNNLYNILSLKEIQEFLKSN